MMTDEAVKPAKTEAALADDLLIGAKQIAAFTGWSERQIFYMASKGELRSIFILNRKLHARRSSLIHEIQQFEAAGKRG